MSEKEVVATTMPVPKKISVRKRKSAIPESPAVPAVEAKLKAAKPGNKSKKSKKNSKTTDKGTVKVKVVRDSFTMPKDEYVKINELKQACLKAGIHVKKSELLRAGLRALSAMSITELKRVIGKLDTIKTGRPKKLAT